MGRVSRTTAISCALPTPFFLHSRESDSKHRPGMDTKGQDQTSPLAGQRLHKGKQTHLHILFIYPKGRKRNGDVNPGAGGNGHVHSEVTGSIQPPPLMGKSGGELMRASWGAPAATTGKWVCGDLHQWVVLATQGANNPWPSRH